MSLRVHQGLWCIRSNKDCLFDIWYDKPIETTVRLDQNGLDVIAINWQDNKWTIVQISGVVIRILFEKRKKK